MWGLSVALTLDKMQRSPLPARLSGMWSSPLSPTVSSCAHGPRSSSLSFLSLSITSSFLRWYFHLALPFSSTVLSLDLWVSEGRRGVAVAAGWCSWPVNLEAHPPLHHVLHCHIPRLLHLAALSPVLHYLTYTPSHEDTGLLSAGSRFTLFIVAHLGSEQCCTHISVLPVIEWMKKKDYRLLFYNKPQISLELVIFLDICFPIFFLN